MPGRWAERACSRVVVVVDDRGSGVVVVVVGRLLRGPFREECTCASVHRSSASPLWYGRASIVRDDVLQAAPSGRLDPVGGESCLVAMPGIPHHRYGRLLTRWQRSYVK